MNLNPEEYNKNLLCEALELCIEDLVRIIRLATAFAAREEPLERAQVLLTTLKGIPRTRYNRRDRSRVMYQVGNVETALRNSEAPARMFHNTTWFRHKFGLMNPDGSLSITNLTNAGFVRMNQTMRDVFWFHSFGAHLLSGAHALPQQLEARIRASSLALTLEEDSIVGKHAFVRTFRLIPPHIVRTIAEDVLNTIDNHSPTDLAGVPNGMKHFTICDFNERVFRGPSANAEAVPWLRDAKVCRIVHIGRRTHHQRRLADTAQQNGIAYSSLPVNSIYEGMGTLHRFVQQFKQLIEQGLVGENRVYVSSHTDSVMAPKLFAALRILEGTDPAVAFSYEQLDENTRQYLQNYSQYVTTLQPN